MEQAILDALNKEEALLEKIAQKSKEMFPNGCNKILLVNIPQVGETDFDLATAKLKRYPCFPPYGLGLLSHGLRVAGYSPLLIDLNFEILSSVNDLSFRYDRWQNVLRQTMESFVPDMVGVSCMFSANHASMKAVVDYVKMNYPQTAIIVGGVHPSNNTRMVLETIPNIDAVIAYEADEALVNFIDFVSGQASKKSLTQIAMFQKGEYLNIERKIIPRDKQVNYSPDYGTLPIGKYGSYGEIGVYRWLRKNPPVATILSNRGCRGSCTFCSVRSFNGKGVRRRNRFLVVDEMQRQAEEYGVKHFMWLDDDLFQPDSVDLFNEITRRNLNITWDASNGVMASATTNQIIQAACESGCIGLSFGIESGDPDILRMIKKPSGIKHFMAVSEILKNFPKIFAKGFLMVGFPDETVGKIWNTINLARTMALDWYPIQIMSPFGGTEIAKKLVERGVINEHTILSSKMFVGPSGGQRLRERREIDSSNFKPEVLDKSRSDKIPTQEELPDIWFMMDYLINYEPIPKITNQVKLEMQRLNLRAIIDRLPKHIAMASLYLGIVNKKLGNNAEATCNFEETRKYLEESAFWQVRFEKLNLNKILREVSI